MAPFVVGIAGGTASGKSSVAHAVAAALGERCVVLLHDRYYHDLPMPFRADPMRYNFDHPNALDTDRLVTDLRSLRRGRRTSVPRYNYATHFRYAEEDAIEPRPIVLVEGILVLAHSDLRTCFDCSYFVHAPDDIRLIRRIRRDIRERGRTVEAVLEQYERTVRPMHEEFVAPSCEFADEVLDGTAPIEGLVGRVLARVGS